jgi:hypothetical protein
LRDKVSDQQSTGPNVQEHVIDEYDRVQAADVIRRAFPARLKRWGTSRFAISRARNGSTDNFLYRAAQAIRIGRRSGAMTKDQAMLLPVHLMAVIEAEFSQLPSFEVATLSEQIFDGLEDEAQMRALVDAACLHEYPPVAKAHIAKQLVAVASAEAELVRRRA